MTIKKILTIFIIIPCNLFAQQTINDSIFNNNIYRSFTIYIPQIYNPTQSTPLVFNLHGLGGSSITAMYHADFRNIADTANFIIVHPQGMPNSLGENHWNYGQSNIDDISFFNALYSYMLTNYNIDVDRVYSAGMSNGGAMSYSLACNLSSKIAAIASVTGAMSSYQHLSCNPTHPTPIMEIHGTADSTVLFAWVTPGIEYWRNYNNCNINADTTQIGNIVLSDSSTVEHIVYNNGDNGVTTELFKIIGGEHTWPGSNFSNGVTNYDINASIEIWRFFSRYDINGLINPATEIIDNNIYKHNLVKITDLLGRETMHNKQSIIYIYKNNKVKKKIIIE